MRPHGEFPADTDSASPGHQWCNCHRRSRPRSDDSGVVDVTADVLEDAVVVVVVVWVSEVVVSAVVITEDVDAVPSSTNSLLNFAAYVCAVEPA